MNKENYLDSFRLKHKNVFVAGGLGLIGYNIVEALQFSEANTVVLDIHSIENGSKLLKRVGNEQASLDYEKLDLTAVDALSENLNLLFDKYGIPDVWINSSYPRTNDWHHSIEQLEVKSFQKNVDMQLNSYVWSSRVICLAMKERGSGSVINLSSIYGILGPDFQVYKGTDMTSPFAYSAIKSGVINATKYLASYFGKYNIRVNAVCPGGVFDNQPERFVKNYSEKVPLGRLANPEEIAKTVIFLASEASSYITGHSLVVDGGWTSI